MASKAGRVWCIGADGTEFYAAHSEEELGQFYVGLVGWKQALEDISEGYREVVGKELDAKFPFVDDDGKKVKTSLRALAHEAVLPTQICSSYT